jgi:hypothetical protein
MTVNEFAILRAERVRLMEQYRDAIAKDASAVKFSLLPANLREATPADISLGNVIWYKDLQDDLGGQNFAIVDKVLDITSRYYAFEYEGKQLGLNGAFVDTEEWLAYER